MVAQAFNPSIQEVEAGRSLLVRDQPGLLELVPGQESKSYGETLSQKIPSPKKERSALLFSVSVRVDFFRISFLT